MIINNPEYRAAVEELDSAVIDNMVFISVNDMNGISQQILQSIGEMVEAGMVTEEQMIAVQNVIQIHTSLYDTITDSYAEYLVPDTVEGLDDE